MTVLIDICIIFLRILMYVVLVRVIITWIPHNPNQPLFRFLFSVTDPLLKPFRFARVGMMDFSPILLFVLISILISVLGSIR